MKASEVQVTTVRYEGGPNPIRLSVVGEHIHIHRVRYSLHATVFVTASALAWHGRYEPDMQQAGWSFEVETNTIYLSRDDGGDCSYAARKWAKIHACMAAAQWLHDDAVLRTGCASRMRGFSCELPVGHSGRHRYEAVTWRRTTQKT